MSNPIVEFYRDKEGGIRWRRIASNGETIAHSGPSYSEWNDAYDGMMASCTGLNGVNIVDRSMAEPES